MTSLSRPFSTRITAYPAKINSFNLDKDPVAEGTLLGIKGQYLMFDSGVINIRKYTALPVGDPRDCRLKTKRALDAGG